MSPSLARERRVIIGVLVGALAGVAILGRQAMPWGLGIAAAAAGWWLWRVFEAGQHGQKVVEGLRQAWLELPGAALAHDDAVHVHDGAQPVVVRVSRRDGALRVTVSTLIGEQPAAFRIWPPGQPRPTLDPAGSPVGGPPTERAPHIEGAFAGLLKVETSDEARVARLLDTEVVAAILVVQREAPDSFGGLAYDGRHLTVHLRGPICADPPRSAALARALWRPMVAPADAPVGGSSAPLP